MRASSWRWLQRDQPMSMMRAWTSVCRPRRRRRKSLSTMMLKTNSVCRWVTFDCICEWFSNFYQFLLTLFCQLFLIFSSIETALNFCIVRWLFAPRECHQIGFCIYCPDCSDYTCRFLCFFVPYTVYIHTHIHNRLTALVWDNPGRPVAEETLTYWHPAGSSDIRYHLAPFTTIHSILFVHFTCSTILSDNLSPGPLWSSSTVYILQI